MAGPVVDTRALVWYLLGSPRLSVTARNEKVGYSPADSQAASMIAVERK